MKSTDLEDLILRIRKAWYDITLSESFASNAEVDPDAVTAALRRLALLGRELRTKLFKYETRSAMARVGEWLENHPLTDGAVIQVSTGKGADGFAFPWSLIFDREIPPREDLRPDPSGFWGMRYVIEQLPSTVSGTDEPARVEGPLRLELMQWDLFRNIALQNALIEDLRAESRGRLVVSHPPVVDAASCYALLRDNKAQILYFYAHGYARHRESDSTAGLDFELFLNRYERLPQASQLRSLWEPVYKDIQEGRTESARSWIELTYGKLFLDELYDRIKDLGACPLVILNMCESAQVTPMLGDSFVHFFLSRGARAVIGTECPMTIEFAHPFSGVLLREILAGSPAGAAMLSARRRMMELGNPLGLAYSLFGLATARLEPPALDHGDAEDHHVKNDRGGGGGGPASSTISRTAAP